MMTDENDIDSYHFSIVTMTYDREAAAWEEFKREAQRHFKWTRGEKVWRVPPTVVTLTDDTSVDKNCTSYRIRARVLAFEKLPNGMEAAKPDGPYPEPVDPPDVGFV